MAFWFYLLVGPLLVLSNAEMRDGAGLIVAGAAGVGGLLVGLLHRRHPQERWRIALGACLGVMLGIGAWGLGALVLNSDWETGLSPDLLWKLGTAWSLGWLMFAPALGALLMLTKRSAPRDRAPRR